MMNMNYIIMEKIEENSKRITMKIIITIVLLCFITAGYAINLDSIPQVERDSILKQLAKTTVLLYGPDYYRDAQIVINRKNYDFENPGIVSVLDAINERKSGAYYSVKSLYDQSKELFEMDYASEVFVWANDPMVFEVLFGNGWSLELDEKRGTQINEMSNQIKSNSSATTIVRSNLNISTMHFDTLPLKMLPSKLIAMQNRVQRDSLSKQTKRLELKQQFASDQIFDNKIWKKQLKVESKCLLKALKKESDRLEKILLRDIKYFNKISSTEYDQFNTVKHFRKLKKRIILPTFIVDEKKIANLKDSSSVTSNMHYSPNEVSIYIGDKKHVFYRVTWKKTKEQWKYRSCERIPLSLSKKLIQSGLYKNIKKAETLVLQQDGKVKNLVFFKKRKKMTFLDSKNFLNDYQSTIPNLK